jgi:hypothetical protein
MSFASGFGPFSSLCSLSGSQSWSSQSRSATMTVAGLPGRAKTFPKLLGYTQISMTMDVYSHVLPGMQQDAMSKLDAALLQQERNDDKQK